MTIVKEVEVGTFSSDEVLEFPVSIFESSSIGDIFSVAMSLSPGCES